MIGMGRIFPLRFRASFQTVSVSVVTVLADSFWATFWTIEQSA